MSYVIQVLTGIKVLNCCIIFYLSSIIVSFQKFKKLTGNLGSYLLKTVEKDGKHICECCTGCLDGFIIGGQESYGEFENGEEQ